jgi:TonB family protein
MQNFASNIWRRTKFVLVAALSAAAIFAVPQRLAAQDTTVYDQEEVTVVPKLISKSRAGDILRRAYPEKLQQVGIEGSAQIAVVIGLDGKVEAGSGEVISATVPAFGSAGKDAAEKFEFKPGRLKGTPVRVRILVPMVFKLR